LDNLLLEQDFPSIDAVVVAAAVVVKGVVVVLVVVVVVVVPLVNVEAEDCRGTMLLSTVLDLEWDENKDCCRRRR
jgi:hypothetical protein